MRMSRKPLFSAAIALVALVIISSMGLAGTGWGPRSYTSAFAFPGGGATLLLASPAGSTEATGGRVLSGGAHGVAKATFLAARDSVTLCPAPCTGKTLAVLGSLLGLGNNGETIEMDAQSIPLITCTNQGGNAAPGRNPGVIILSQTLPIDPTKITKNGRYNFNLAVNGSGSDYPIGPLAGLATGYGCPNDNWSAAVTSYKFLSSTLTATLTGGGTTSVTDTF